ncbi:molybdopterin converting factor subunit 1 [Sneathiella sp. P13V-1]|uniref:molybdopterin converting factor subunit 1 n=1 Tax=Sneathiella sp. P13V-1 TaxID=2697366 RepID=UPI00187BBE53|nr:molybdopterin converting factor subunit 1 [Sneathiella sp. P13V-1]MBE7638059.1 molybdopterin converting factor subunit 1 [Sneathiella sp. P13V-1]
MKILYFAWLRSSLGKSEETITLPEEVTHLNDLVDWLKKRGPEFEKAFSDMSTVRIALNQEYVTDNPVLNGDEEIAFFPPVTGG